MTSLLAFLVVIGISVVIHESGHFLAARACGVRVDEFAFGMGPAVLSRQGKETRWSLRLFPLGGFVRLAGMGEPGETPCPPERSFGGKTAGQRFVILAAGSAFNLLLAWILTVLLLMGYGILDLQTPRVGEVMAGYPAQQAGIEPGDRIVGINNRKVEDWKAMASAIRREAPKGPVHLEVEREGVLRFLTVEIPTDPKEKAPLLGVRPARRTMGLLEATTQGWGYSWRMGMEILSGIWRWVFRTQKVDLTGPVGIASMAGEAARQGFWEFLSFLAILNLHLGLLNLLPFPALDGGRLVFVGLEAVLRRKVPERYENYIHYAGFVLLLTMILFVTWKDVSRLLQH
ncbi:membrane-associated zinc metalloprotease [Aminomonas paucivorans DSM 12260]|uniref:Membrane-associated zinc metalloprotease n=1 Tax=Aminomonas paucivorans DSM 12260 TaxID=584708 RepID=E3D0L8_9BACT|nr:M50 family metallopeptidase [Aminomonas paucivorans]EFQ23839.1 membrane-associated zinc metalloprotease [Aminomonas paucivorans DSM 12260]